MVRLRFCKLLPEGHTGRGIVGNLVDKARRYATSAHARIGQSRKYTLQPYDAHLRAVARLVASVSGDKAMIAASWLHDTVEDTPATFEELEKEFGAEVAYLVKELTDISKPGDGNRAARKAIDRRHLALASPRAKTIKLADLIDNCQDICRNAPKFARVYLQEAEALMEVLREGDSTLYERARKTLANCARQIGGDSAGADGFDAPPADVPADTPQVAGYHGIRLFTEAFTARDILEPLLSFDGDSVPDLARMLSGRHSVPVVGVRTHGSTVGYLTREDMSDVAAEKIRPIAAQQTVYLETPLTDLIHILTHFSYCFVKLNDMVIGVIGRRDIEKPVVRMWLFGIIMLIEMLLAKEIRRRWPDGDWEQHVSENRLEKAKELKAERERRGYYPDLLDCLQLPDKLYIMLTESVFMKDMGFASVRAAKRAIRELESLRNALAHGQDITTRDWPPIVRLARRIQLLYSG